MSQGTDNFHANTFLTCRCLFCSPCNVVYNTILRLKCVKNYHVIFPHMDRKYMIKPTPLSRQKLDHVTKYKLQTLTVINTSIILILHLPYICSAKKSTFCHLSLYSSHQKSIPYLIMSDLV